MRAEWRHRATLSAAVAVSLLMFMPILFASGQSTSSVPTWAKPGATFTYSVSFSLSGPLGSGGQATSTSQSGTITETVVSVTGTSAVFQQSQTGLGTATATTNTYTYDLSSPFPSASGGPPIYQYIPPSEIQTTMGGLVSAFETVLNVASQSGLTVTPSGPSLGSVSTPAGSSDAWTLSVQVSGTISQSGSTVQLSGSGSISYDSLTGLLVNAHAAGTGTLSSSSGGPSGNVALNIDLTLQSASFALAAGGGGGLGGLSTTTWIIIGVVVAAVVVVAVVGLTLMRRGKAVPPPSPEATPASTSPPSPT